MTCISSGMAPKSHRGRRTGLAIVCMYVCMCRLTSRGAFRISRPDSGSSISGRRDRYSVRPVSTGTRSFTYIHALIYALQCLNISNHCYFEKKLGSRISGNLDENFSRKNKVTKLLTTIFKCPLFVASIIV